MRPLQSAPKTPTAPRPEISAPMDGRKLAPGPNQLAGLLGKAPDKLKGQVLDLQNRPAAFHEGSQATRRLAGRDVTISSPIMGARIPTGKEYGMPGKGGTGNARTGTPASRKDPEKGSGPAPQDPSSLEGRPASQALVRREGGSHPEGGSQGRQEQPGPGAMVKYEGKGEPRIVGIPDFPSSFGRTSDLPRRGSFDLSSAAGGHDPLALVKRDSQASPARITEIPDLPAAPPSQALVRRESKGTGKPESAPMDLSSAAGGHDPLKPAPKKAGDDAARMTTVPEHVPTPMSNMATVPEHIPSPAASGTPAEPVFTPRPQLHRQDTRPHVDPGLENLHLSQPGDPFEPPPAYAQKPPPGHKTTETGPPVAGDLPEEAEKKMGLGKKVMMGVGGIAALLGVTFLMSTPTPPPPPEKST